MASSQYARPFRPATAPLGRVSTHVHGFVEAANDKGIRVQGEWHNWSKYNRVDFRPNVGAEVHFTTKNGWIETMEEPVDAFAEASQRNSRPPPPPPPPAAAWQAAQAATDRDGAAERRQRQITRCVCVKAAATLHGGTKEATWEKCLATAAAMEAWITDESEYTTAGEHAA